MVDAGDVQYVYYIQYTTEGGPLGHGPRPHQEGVRGEAVDHDILVPVVEVACKDV